MKPGCTLFLLLFSALTASITAHAQLSSSTTTAPYLLAGSPTFDLSISQFRENFNRQNPDLPLNEFRAIENSRDKANLTRAASKINENLYASTALERGTLKVKSMQITWLPIQGPEQKAAKAKALEYMAAIIRTVAPLLTKEQSQKKLQKMLIAGKGKHYYAETEGAVRYVVADKGEKGLTFAVEPIKLTLSENLEGAN
ncbi:YiiQ family protein [Salmonella enterica]|uniref:YiiQ family protein n=1 Tax=Salmonella enterica TaxID=28901 RepID=UPI0005E26D61|nr:YiiQ family protein [Salmonella enterica]EEH4515081.1 YiiQ family protein [Salmonella enterica subsp. enterica serovar Typhimurium]EGF9135125.1 YiiQ family protein [Salmonella enterica]EGU2023962.1 YiiQ family protein [Salmonella enterica subsp. enterica serovar Typhimurium]EGU2315388.1 YiiQ family protein [Salmonella enterica]EHD5141659.1 YiiQ family protein [Salmonella enterica subsp. enterica serovar Typhimurium]